MSIPEVALAVHHECARDKTLTKRREFAQNPGRMRETAPRTVVNFREISAGRVKWPSLDSIRAIDGPRLRPGDSSQS
jgi:hypothetical protein